MENVQMLLPIEPKEFWHRLKMVVEEVVEQKSASYGSSPSDNPSTSPLLKAKEVCELFKVSKPTVYDWMNQGKLKSIKIKSRRYFLWKDIEELIHESQSKTGAAIKKAS